MNDAIRQFAVAARAFCDWAEDQPSAPEDEVALALLHLTALYQLALRLPECFGEGDAPAIPDEEWKKMFRRFGVLPFNYYSECYNPHIVPSEEPDVVGDLADDFADIWRDLKGGLGLYDAGKPEAASWQWREHFWYHWGRHAVGAVYALHCWLAQNPDKFTGKTREGSDIQK